MVDYAQLLELIDIALWYSDYTSDVNLLPSTVIAGSIVMKQADVDLVVLAPAKEELTVHNEDSLDQGGFYKLNKADGDSGGLEMEESLMSEGKGEWYHSWYHLICITAGSGVLAYPASFAYLGWIAGIVCWVIGILFAYYTSYIIAEVVQELSEKAGRRIVRFRDICRMVWGPTYGIIAIVPWQYLNVVTFSIALMVGAAQGLQGVQTTLQPTVAYETAAASPVPLWGYIMICSFIWWITALIPRFHELRFLSFLALACFVCFSSIVIALCFNHGHIAYAGWPSPKVGGFGYQYGSQGLLDQHHIKWNLDPSLEIANGGPGYRDPTLTETVFGIMNALGTIAFAYGNCIIPEVMGTAADGTSHPKSARDKMYRAFDFEFLLSAPYYLMVGIAGYWAYGFGTVQYNFVLAQLLPFIPNPSTINNQYDYAGASYEGFGYGYIGDGPAWVIVLANLTVFLQAILSCQVYNQVLYDVFDPYICKKDFGIWHPWNVFARTVVRTTYIVLIAFVACLLPFFGAFISLIGAVSAIPSVFVVPCLLHLAVIKPSKTSWKYYADIIIGTIALIIGFLGTISSCYTIKQSAVTFQVFSPTGPSG
ncbi:hypothetical protein CEUSTIGMA_g1790.t1 [Chlamydomonas eustigma]|uniref:Amino acid transporter transmembrane domain-containing protein n=1 Tax=Chlamydomonas eustigma TaxID=1157962 RepID=A0A250WU45_9CHLO|nr:hypothetical protein CEUSTIGMA_g1790.t1 [Chlamydomonas eustigma]|eukprot:GAX74341.1 hypothetical protein CEUSTIGMA_g1790.t1 [Chlamydomonas eustigma]